MPKYKVLGFTVLLIFLLAAVASSKSFTTAESLPSFVRAANSEQVYVPAGPFSMGCANDLFAVGCDSDAHPIHVVYLDAYYIDKTEVTQAQYAACVAAGACSTPLPYEPESRFDYHTHSFNDDYPVTHVDWSQAKAYCSWVGKRLPTEAEWEKAARGTDLRMYPWGNELPTCERANFQGCVETTLPVNNHSDYASPYGALNMAGNVSEWVNDVYLKDYYKNSPYFNPPGPDAPDYNEHLIRGGSWAANGSHLTTFIRLDGADIYVLDQIGFRCAQSAGGEGTLTPTPTPLPAPASRAIGPKGGIIWQSYPSHLTLLDVPSGSVTRTTVFTIQYNLRTNQQQALEGLDHFFVIDAGSDVRMPLSLMLGYPEQNPLVSDTIGLYRLEVTNWVTKGITLTEIAPGSLSALIDRTGTFGLLGKTNRVYLPLVLR